MSSPESHVAVPQLPLAAVEAQFGAEQHSKPFVLRDCLGLVSFGDVDADERAEGVRVDAVVAVTHDRPVDVAGDDQGQRVSCGAERLLHAWRVEQAEGDVERFAETSVAVIVDFSRVHHDANP